jgi:hypothetical protein
VEFQILLESLVALEEVEVAGMLGHQQQEALVIRHLHHHRKEVMVEQEQQQGLIVAQEVVVERQLQGQLEHQRLAGMVEMVQPLALVDHR